MDKKLRKKPKTLPYPEPTDDKETKNRKMRDARIISGTIRTEAPVDARDIGSTQSQYNRGVSNAARISFKEIGKLRGQMEFIEDLPNLKARKTVAIEQQVKRMINKKPWHKFSDQEMTELNNLSPKLREEVIRANERNFKGE